MKTLYKTKRILSLRRNLAINICKNVIMRGMFTDIHIIIYGIIS
jgi:hypothetical protein